VRDIGPGHAPTQQKFCSFHPVAEELTVQPPRKTAEATAENDAGAALYRAGQIDEAMGCFKRALQLDPACLAAHNNLGLAHFALGQMDASVASFHHALRIDPQHAEVHNNLARTLREMNRTDEAVAHCRTALALRPDYADVHGNLGGLYLMQNRHDEALAAFRRQVLLDPKNVAAMHQIAALAGANTERAPARYVESVFDGYADRFDSHLVAHLHYRTPEILVDFLVRRIAQPPGGWDVLDLGCGTGLSGQAIAPHARSLCGVDLSANMLQKARERGIYQRLVKQDLLPMMRAEPGAGFDLLIATDVFIYLGKLDDILREAKRLLRSGGVFAFSIEALAEAGDYRLTPSGRYAHAPAYIARLAEANRFHPQEIMQTTLRVESSAPVAGHLLLLKS
jgi:predicted TPR repeat methyltransferase